MKQPLKARVTVFKVQAKFKPPDRGGCMTDCEYLTPSRAELEYFSSRHSAGQRLVGLPSPSTYYFQCLYFLLALWTAS